MSFRGNGQRRYGAVPPVQYPVANRQTPDTSYPPRRPSFNNGDDRVGFDSGSDRQGYQQAAVNSRRPAAGEELFLGSPTEVNRNNYGSNNAAMSGYQHHYGSETPTTPTTSSYNPQAFNRTQSQSVPYRHSPSVPPRPGTNPPAPMSYTPAPYNPAAYSNTTPTSPHRQQTYAGYSSYAQQPQMNQSTYWQSQPTYTSPPPQTTQAPTPPTRYPTYDHTSPARANFDLSSPQFPRHPPYSTSATSPPPSVYSPTSSQPPYPTYSQIPVGPNYSAADPHSFVSRTPRSGSHVSPLPSPPIHQPQLSPGLQRHPTNAPLPRRPTETNAEDTWQSNGTYRQDVSAERITQENIMQDIEAELNRGSGSQRSRTSAYDHRNGNAPADDEQDLRRFASTASYDSTATTIYSQEDASGVNRYSSNASTLNRNHSQNSYAYQDDGGEESDPEGAAGVLAMQQADEDERRLSGGVTFPYFNQPEVTVQHALPNLAEESTSDSDYGGLDLGLYSGGYAGNLAYDNNVASPPASEPFHDENQTLPIRSNHPSQRSQGSSSNYPAFEQADVDYGGTGGLHAPSTHRLSFDDGDEGVSVHSGQSGSESPSREEYPDMFYHPGLSNRPLPAIPVSTDSSELLSVQSPSRGPYQHGYSLSVDTQPYTGPDAYYGQNAQQLQVERSISLSSHSTSPQIQPPARSRTDAEDRNNRVKQMRQQQQLAAQQGLPYEGYDTSGTASMSYDVITLPTGRRKRFIPEKITLMDTMSCTEPWALSGVSNWIREMADGEPDLKRKTVEDGLVRLFCLKVPTLNVADAETLSLKVVDSMLEAGILIPDEEWLKFGPGTITGVLWQLTGSGCYAPKLHEFDEVVSSHEIPGRCYSHFCGRTLKKVNLDELLSAGVKKDDWITHYGLTQEDLKDKPKKEIARQNNLHELVTTEEVFMDQLEVLRVVYRDQLQAARPPIIAENRLDKFVTAVFGKVDHIVQVNKENLLAQLKYRQKEQGPWIFGFSDIFREWIRAARVAWVEYASAYPYAYYLFKREAERNYMFKQFLDRNQADPRSQKLDWSTFLKSPVTRMPRYTLLLETALKHMVGESEEKTNMQKAIEEIKQATHEADAKIAEMSRKVEMMELDQMLVLRPGFHADLNLDHLGRELIFKGDLQRLGSKGVRWVDTHALLFDHYLILAKLVTSKDGRYSQKYDVSKEPIPMPLLFLENSGEDPVAKQKGLAAPLTRATGSSPDVARLSKTVTNGSERPGLEHAATSSSVTSASTTRLTTTVSTDSEGKTLYPFRIKHLGHELYTLFALSAADREKWCAKIIEAKTRHAKALHAQNAEPFRLRVIADSAFAYDAISAIGKYVPGVHISGTPLDRAIRDIEKTFGPGRGPAAVSRSAVNCATGFTAFGKNMVAVGTDIGVFVAEASEQRGWLKTVTINRVNQIAVLEEFSVVLVLAERNLISYPLDVISPPSNFPAPTNDSHRRAPQRLAKDVSFFATARMKERMLVFYKKKEGLHSTFKVLEPVFQKATEKRSRLFSAPRGRAGNTETFRDYDEFFFPVECYSLNIFHTYISIATQKGFELLTLDKKVPMSIPDVKQPAIANIANRIAGQKPLGMFRLNDQEFLLAYEDCAVYIDKYGDVSRSVIMEYSGKQRKAKSATMYGQYLLLFNDDYVEVRNAENGRLRQIIAGRDVRVLDYGVRGPTGGSTSDANGVADAAVGTGAEGEDGKGLVNSKGTVKICMAHPELAGQQILLEMVLNEGH